MKLRLLILLPAAIAAGWLTLAAAADPGVGISPGMIEVNDSLEPGGRYDLPSVGVTNTGDVRQEYRLTIRHYEDGGTLRVPSNWVNLTPQNFTLAPGEHRQIGVRVVLPGSAEPGSYLTLIEAQMVSGQAIQGGVATTLSFSVDESGWIETLRRQLARLLEDASPWPQVLGIGGLLVIALRWSSKRVRFRLPFEPR